MLTELLHRCRLRARQMQIFERPAIFVGLWPPTIRLIGDLRAQHE
jgi:hypothetical protein